MSSYKKGTIYKIICAISDEVYIGSTFNTLRNRWQHHKSRYTKYLENNENGNFSIFPYFKKYGIDKFKIIKIKEYECVDRKHLESKEQLRISKTKCVNKNNAFNFKKLTKKKWDTENKDYIKVYNKNNIERTKKWHIDNKDILKIKRNKYRIKKKNHIKKTAKDYYEKNKEILNKKIDCVCGSKYSKQGKARHEKTKKHKTFINQ